MSLQVKGNPLYSKPLCRFGATIIHVFDASLALLRYQILQRPRGDQCESSNLVFFWRYIPVALPQLTWSEQVVRFTGNESCGFHTLLMGWCAIGALVMELFWCFNAGSILHSQCCEIDGVLNGV